MKFIGFLSVVISMAIAICSCSSAKVAETTETSASETEETTVETTEETTTETTIEMTVPVAQEQISKLDDNKGSSPYSSEMEELIKEINEENIDLDSIKNSDVRAFAESCLGNPNVILKKADPSILPGLEEGVISCVVGAKSYTQSACYKFDTQEHAKSYFGDTDSIGVTIEYEENEDGSLSISAHKSGYSMSGTISADGLLKCTETVAF